MADIFIQSSPFLHICHSCAKLLKDTRDSSEMEEQKCQPNESEAGGVFSSLCLCCVCY